MDNAIERDIDLIRRMETEMQRMADEAMRALMMGERPPARLWQPRVDVYETQDAIIVKMEIAGVDSATLRVCLSGDDRYLTVAGERREEESERAARVRCHRLEIYFGPFEARVQLPAGLRYNREAIKARYTKGMLVVTLAKRQPSRITVNTGQDSE